MRNRTNQKLLQSIKRIDGGYFFYLAIRAGAAAVGYLSDAQRLLCHLFNTNLVNRRHVCRIEVLRNPPDKF